MLEIHDVKSHPSIGGTPLSTDEACRVLDTCDQVLRERGRIAAALADLPDSWPKVSGTLNELQAIVS